jgi:TetR/AcrR family transcriptional regulator, transcriptional repressor for nem operon
VRIDGIHVPLVDGIGVVDLMSAAELTHEGFYRQFKSKDDLVVQAVKRAYNDMSEDLAYVDHPRSIVS